jgi:hypothetical protein
VNSAKLRLSLRNSSSSATASTVLSIAAVANTAWSSSTLNWNNRPAIGAALASVTVASTTAEWFEIDVTQHVAAERAAGRQVVAFAVSATTSDNLTYVSSIEASSSLRPTLVVSQ